MDNKDAYKDYDEKMQNSKTKAELAKELGIQVPKDGYWGDVPSRICGTVGGALGGGMVRHAIESFEKSLVDDSNIRK